MKKETGRQTPITGSIKRHSKLLGLLVLLLDKLDKQIPKWELVQVAFSTHHDQVLKTVYLQSVFRMDSLFC